MEVDLTTLQQEAERDGAQPVVGALIHDELGRAFIHRRGYDRELLPGCWDIVGGHVEQGEHLREALDREVREETGWEVAHEPVLAHVADWEFDGHCCREFDFLVRVRGDLSRPVIERPKHVEFRWVREEELDILRENRRVDGGLVEHLVRLALRRAKARPLAFPHATLFFDAKTSALVQPLRKRWDPAMAREIAPHVSVTYPEEIPDADQLVKRVAHAAPQVRPFALRLDQVGHWGDPRDGVRVDVVDVEGGWTALRSLILGDRPWVDVEPHLTLVHPRTTNRGPAAFKALARLVLGHSVTVRAVSVTAFDGDVCSVVSEFHLGSDARVAVMAGGPALGAWPSCP